jgi:hypothetical protein
MKWHSRVAFCLAAVSVACGVAGVARADEVDQCADEAEQAPLLRDKGRWLEARRLFEMCAADACPRIVRDDCRKALAGLSAQIPKLDVRVHDDHGQDVIDAEVTVDGVRVDADDRARGVEVDPGTHVVRAVRPPLASTEERVVVVEADRARVVDLVLGAPAPAPSLAVHVAPAPVATSSPGRDRTAAIVVGSIGLGLVAGFGAVGTWTLVDYQRLHDECAPRCGTSQVDPVRTRGIVADALLGAGLVSLVVAGVLWLSAPEHHASKVGIAWTPP